jgi:NADH-quinone oxidoreductase subunit F
MDKPLTSRMTPSREPLDLAGYERVGGYGAVRRALGQFAPQEVTELVKSSNLRGRGGAGFPTGMKWGFVPMGEDAPRPKYIVSNADEMEPGTFKDRLLLEADPHGMIESMIVSGWALQADYGYIFIRWAYRTAARRLRRAIEEAREAGWLGKNILGTSWSFDIFIHVSAGRYMCGEETGLLNALEGKRATPRSKPPYPQQSGLWGRPTIVQNVETLYNVPHIIERGADWFRSLSRGEDAGTKLYGVSGKVRQPGLWELPMGATAREILEDRAGGMREGTELKGFLPGGASTDFLTREHLDLPLDFDSVAKAGSRLGTGTLIVLDDQTCPVGMVLNLERFFAQESCGWCTPCREGLPWAARVLAALERGEGDERDLELLEQQGQRLGPGLTFCALAPGAAEPLLSALKHFRGDFERHLREKGCPFGHGRAVTPGAS